MDRCTISENNRPCDTGNYSWAGGGLIGLLVLIPAIVLAVTGRYPRGLFDFILGSTGGCSESPPTRR